MKRIVLSEEIGPELNTTKINPLQKTIFGAEGPIVITSKKQQQILSAKIYTNGGLKASTWARVLDPQTHAGEKNCYV